MRDEFIYDVFLSHSAKDKKIARDVAKRLKKDGLKVWFDEWAIKPGDSIMEKVEEGLSQSRKLVVCVSRNGFGSDWSRMETDTFRVQDPMNRQRRVITLRLDDTAVNGSLGQFLFVDWQEEADASYTHLFESLRPAVSQEEPLIYSQRIKEVLLKGVGSLRCAVFASSEEMICGNGDNEIRALDAATGRNVERLLIDREDDWDDPELSMMFAATYLCQGACLAMAPCRRRFVYGGVGECLGVFDLETRKWKRWLSIRNYFPRSVSTSRRAAMVAAAIHSRYSGGKDDRLSKSLLLWDAKDKKATAALGDFFSIRSDQKSLPDSFLEGHRGEVFATDISEAGDCAISGSADGSVKVWDVNRRVCTGTLKGHEAPIRSIALAGHQEKVLSGSEDGSVRLWDLYERGCFRSLSGHAACVTHVVFSPDNQYGISVSLDRTVRLWDLSTAICVSVIECDDVPVGVAFEKEQVSLATPSRILTWEFADLISRSVWNMNPTG